MPLGQIGVVPNHSVFQGEIKTDLVEGITTSTWNPRSGGTSKTIFKGTQVQITALAQDAKTNGWEYSIQGGHVWTLEVIFPYDIITDQTEAQSNPLFTWELINQPFEKDLMELGDRPFIQPLSVDTKDQIQQKLSNPEYRAMTPFAPIDTVAGKMVNATVAYNLKRIGVRGKQGIVQSLRRTIVVPNSFDASTLISSQYNYKVFTKANLLVTYNNNANILNNIPAVISSAMPSTLSLSVYNGNLTTFPVQNISGYSMDRQGIVTYVGWLQFPPEYHMVATNKVSIVQHWTFNQWSAGPWGLYDIAIDTTASPNPNSIIGLEP